MTSGSKSLIGSGLAIVAVLATAGLMYWLSIASQPATVAEVQEAGGAEAGESGLPAERVLASVFETAMSTYVGREIELARVRVEQVMTPEIIWVSTPGNQLLLIKLSPQAAANPAPALNSMVDVTGRVLTKTDSILNAWQQSGAIRDAGQRAQAEYGSTFIEARRVVPAAGG